VRCTRTLTGPDCSGAGAAPGSKPRPCASGGGTGRRVISRDQKKDRGSVRFQQVTVCPDCHGQGSFIDKPCRACHGRGQVEKEESLKVHIPPGVEEATALRVAGHGMPAEQPGGKPGDLYVIVTSAPDERFERAGADLWRRETLEVADAVLGTRLQVPTLSGTLAVTVPPGTQPDEVLRLRGKGLPVFGGEARGDIMLRIQVHIPEHPTAEERALWEQLRAMASGGRKAGKRWWQQPR